MDFRIRRERFGRKFGTHAFGTATLQRIMTLWEIKVGGYNENYFIKSARTTGVETSIN